MVGLDDIIFRRRLLCRMVSWRREIYSNPSAHPTCLSCKLASTLCRYSSVIANEGQSGVRESHLLSNGILRTSSHQTFDRPGQPSSIGSDLQWALALPTSSRSRR